MAQFYEWDTQADFDSWHQAIMESKGIPDEVTFAYTTSQTINGKVIATVEDEDSEGLVKSNLRPTLPDLPN
jgi:hypothetical protein